MLNCFSYKLLSQQDILNERKLINPGGHQWAQFPKTARIEEYFFYFSSNIDVHGATTKDKIKIQEESRLQLIL